MTTKKQRISTNLQKNKDIYRLQRAARRLLDRLEKELSQVNVGKMDKPHDVIFGKASLASTLVTLSDLLMQLDKGDDTEESDVQAGGAVLSESDVALVEAFVMKAKATVNITATAL